MLAQLAKFSLVFAFAAFVLGSPPTAAASDGVLSSATQTYELQPDRGLVSVEIAMNVRNGIPSTTTYEPCIQYYWDPYWGLTPYSSTCPHKTNYYINTTVAWVEDSARNLKVSADGGKASLKQIDHQYGFKKYEITFARLFSGHVRSVKVTYQLPGAAPRTGGSVHAGKAYADFCVSGNGPDQGRIRVVIPAAYTVSHYEAAGLSLSSAKSGSKLIFDSGNLIDPINASSCFVGVNYGGYTSDTVTGPDGRPVVVQSWPEDPAWRSAVTSEVASELGRVEALVGRPLPTSGTVVVREVADDGEYAGSFYSDTLVATVSEAYADGATVSHELAHTWFNSSLFASPWLVEGYAQWAEGSTTTASCDHLPAYPATGRPDLQAWKYLQPKATSTDTAVVTYQYAASCWLIADLSARIGQGRMTSVLAAIFDHTSPYGSDAAVQSGPITWQTWLDDVDELGMVPAGQQDLSAMQDHLAQVGVLTDKTTLAARASARAAYHQLLDATSWSVPEAVLAPLSKWDFDHAAQALEFANAAFQSAQQAASALPESNALNGFVKAKWESASTTADLQAVAKAAADQADAARTVAKAQADIAGSHDPVTTLGLLGFDSKPTLDAAVAAVAVGNSALALQDANLLTGEIQGAMLGGVIRLAIGLTLVGLLAFFSLRRRRRARLVASAERQPVIPTLEKVTISPRAATGFASTTGSLEDEPGPSQT